jgi:hypothetical protein
MVVAKTGTHKVANWHINWGFAITYAARILKKYLPYAQKDDVMCKNGLEVVRV